MEVVAVVEVEVEVVVAAAEVMLVVDSHLLLNCLP